MNLLMMPFNIANTIVDKVDHAAGAPSRSKVAGGIKAGLALIFNGFDTKKAEKAWSEHKAWSKRQMHSVANIKN